MGIYDPGAEGSYASPDYASARENLNTASSTLNRSPQSFDNAAARVRNRLNAAGNGQSMKLRSSFQSNGLGNSGMARYAQRRNFADTQDAYAGGLVDLQKNRDDQDIQRGQGLTTIGNQFANLAGQREQTGTTLRGQDLNQTLGLGQQALTQRGQDMDQQTSFNAQRIQESLGNSNTLKDLMSSQLEFGNTKLNTGGQQTVDKIIQYLLTKAS